MDKKQSDFIVAYCGLACSNCGMYLKGRCAGCHSDKPMNTHCKMKACAVEHQYITCADCTQFSNLKECRKLNNLVAKFFGFIFRTNRIGNLYRIRETGLDAFIQEKRQQGRA